MESLKSFNKRMTLYLAIMCLGFCVLGYRLYALQLSQGGKYRKLSERNRLRVHLIAPIRGVIRDTHDTILAQGRRVFHLYVIKINMAQVEHALRRLQILIHVSDIQVDTVLKNARMSRRGAKILILKDMTWQDISRIYVNKHALNGVEIAQGEIRTYKHKDLYAHIIGYVGAVSKKDIQEKNNSLLFLPGFQVGKTGLENSMENNLRGQAGTKQSEVNARGQLVRILEHNATDALAGDTIHLTVDNRLQAYIHDVLQAYKSASVVVMDVHTGAIRAMVSNPSFDPNLFVGGISHKDWNAIRDNPYRPLVNKCVSGLYAPASTFKPVVALSALEAGVNRKFKVYCTGYKDMFGMRYHCWNKGGHGRVDLVKSLSESCDIWYYEVSQKVGIDNISKMARKLGMGQTYDFGLMGEKSGLIPTKLWKENRYGIGWYKGETVISSIGQGYTLTTPLQLAVMTARIVNGGYAVEPHITHILPSGEAPAESFAKLDIKDSHIKLVKKGMYDVVNAPNGTAYKYHGGFWKMAGKTGTGQVRSISKAERGQGITKNEDREWKYRDNAFFVGYAPLDNPRYAISVLVEHGGSGSSVAAPLARKIFDYMAMLDKQFGTGNTS